VKRRDFCVRSCQAVSLLTLTSAWEGCGGSPTSPGSAPPLPTASGTLVGRTLSVTVDSASPLASVGGAAIVPSSAGVFLVARTGPTTFTALTATCTHLGCTVTGFANQQYVCPCHGAAFSTSGSVVQGPAPSPLRQFATAFANNVLKSRKLTIGSIRPVGAPIAWRIAISRRDTATRRSGSQ
jgi:cytochrome b6-f complex iron-sulfur subunit